MRSFTNREGMTITVDEEHLEKAVEVKLALQEKSPSRRISWSEHKKVMEEEGVFNSDTSESYRCLVKDYQKITGKLNNLPKHADLIFTSKLDAMKRIVGDFRFEKQINQDILREINKNIREMSRTAVMVDEFRNIILDDIDFSVPHYIYEQPKPSSGTKGILIVTDWHIGVKVDNCLGNYYNLEIAQKRLEELKRITLDKCNTHNISDLYIIGLGDWVEHMYMRDNQSQDCEFGVNMQIAKAGKLLFDLIISLAEYANINFASIGGNHDRANGDKKKNHDGDNANVVISENIKDLIEVLKSNSTKKLRRINMLDVQPDSTEIKLKINNKNFKFLHGDKDRGDMKKRLKAHISMDNEFIDYLIHGHLHHYYCIDDDNGRMVIGVGCLMGKNNYSKDIGATTDASQAFIVVEENGDIIPIRIGLQII